MEDCTTSFFINGLKVHIESSINKYEENKNIVFNKDFDNLFLNPIFINNINLFREIITQNNLNFQVFWNHIGKLMKSSMKNILIKFEEESYFFFGNISFFPLNNSIGHGKFFIEE